MQFQIFTYAFAALACLAGYAAAAANNGDLTYYTPGLGSCGWTNTESDRVAALSPAQFAGDPKACGKSIEISVGNVTTVARVVDKCPSCSEGSVDVSPTVFQSVASLDEGRIKMTWNWASEQGAKVKREFVA